MSGGPGPGGRRRRAVEEEHEGGHENAERWLLSYADMITLLMALFVVLFAISQVDQQKLLALSSGMSQYFGTPVATAQSNGILSGAQAESQIGAVAPAPMQVEDSAGGKKAVTSGSTGVTVDPREQLDDVRAALVAALDEEGLRASVEFEQRRDGLVANIVSDRVLFEPGDAALRPVGRRVLDAVAPTLRRVPNQLTVEGHTDDVPVGGRYPSNWELSTARATTVLRYLLTRGVPSDTLSAAGYADQRPLARNTTEAGRATNRRVALLVHVLGAPDATTVPTRWTTTTTPDGGSR